MQFSAVFVVTIVGLIWHHQSKGYFELVEEFGCHNTQFRFTCEQNNSNIVIFKASFLQNYTFLEPLNTSCGDSSKILRRPIEFKDSTFNFFHKTNVTQTTDFNFRHALNRRCSGVKHCKFVVSEDFDEGKALGWGAVYVIYACVHDVEVTRSCHSVIKVLKEGFVRSPGYPGFYPGDSNCLWTLDAKPPQKIRITFLDISLRGYAPFELECLDRVTVSENGLNLFTTCGDILEDVQVNSEGSSLNISFNVLSKTLFPKRGLLFYYKAVGCPTLKKPEDGYLLSRNETFARYQCCIGFVFPDTLSRDRILRCFNENTWDTDLPDCVNKTKIFGEKNTFEGNLIAEARFNMESQDSVVNIIIPIIIICIIFLGNGVVLYFIYHYRKKLQHKEKVVTEKMGLNEVQTKKESLGVEKKKENEVQTKKEPLGVEKKKENEVQTKKEPLGVEKKKENEVQTKKESPGVERKK